MSIEAAATLSFSRQLRRRDDQLSLRFDFYNLAIDTVSRGGPRLRRAAPGAAHVVVVFAPQHLAEQAFRTGGAASDPLAWPVDTRLAGSTRLAFRVPEDVDAIPFNEQELLRWGRLAVAVSPAARPRGTPPPGTALPIAAPGDRETAIELPWRLLISPHGGAAWAHATGAVMRDGWTELWHTRLGTAAPGEAVDEEGEERTVRALWATDPGFAAWLLPANALGAETAPDGSVTPAPGLPFPMALTPRDRVQIVRASADYGIPGYTPEPADVEQLALTSLGAWVRVHGAWDPPASVLSISSWWHHATGGRDQSVRVVRRGYLLPFGHPAALIAVTERTIADAPGGVPTAYLRTRQALAVGRPTKTYPAFGQDVGGRRFPFVRLTVISTLTPDLDLPLTPLVPGLAQRAFVPCVGGTPYPYAFVATDHSGRAVDLTAPVVFVDSTSAFTESDMAQIRAAYNALPADGAVRGRPLGGQAIAYAPSAAPGDTDVETHAVTLEAGPPAGGIADAAFAANDTPRCHPVVARTRIRLSSVEKLTGSPMAPVDARIDDRYATAGFGAGNAGEVFVTLVAPVGMGLPSSRSGFMDPGMDIRALSRRLGPVGGDLDTLASGIIDTPAILAAAPSAPKIFGAIALSSIVRAVPVPPPGQPLVGAIHLGPEPAADGRALRHAPRYTQRLAFEPVLQNDPLGLIDFEPNAYGSVELAFDFNPELRAEHFRIRVVILNGRPWGKTRDLPGAGSGPWLDKGPAFTLRLLGQAVPFIEIKVDKFVFEAESGKDALVEPVIRDGGVRFLGPLQFVQKLADAIPGGGDSAGFGVLFKFAFDHLEFGGKLTFPKITLGALTIKNVMFGLAVELPFLEFIQTRALPLRFDAYFAERQNPFLLAVQCFGGGGFAKLRFGCDGVEMLELAFEFGVHGELDFGIASGMVELMGGIYFRLDLIPGTSLRRIELTAYLRLRGELTALGIVKISLQLYLGLTYVAIIGQAGKLVGQASLTVGVQVLFFSASVSISFERRFSGDDSDPTFLDQVPTQAIWDEYASAFAPVGA